MKFSSTKKNGSLNTKCKMLGKMLGKFVLTVT
jgi:hypothetical protein